MVAPVADASTVVVISSALPDWMKLFLMCVLLIVLAIYLIAEFSNICHPPAPVKHGKYREANRVVIEV